MVLTNQGWASEITEKPRLILQITVDQLRGDLHRRYLPNMGKGGFRYLLENGVVYEDAHHAHATTETIVGHATLATGAHPSNHGLVGNVWFDRTSGTLTYNIEDERYPLLTSGADVDPSTEIDPTQRVARTDGRSPANLLVSTFSDELAIHTANRAKIFGVSIKDRGAVPMAGHAGKAFWFSKAAGKWVTSRFYYDAYPKWVLDYNATNRPSATPTPIGSFCTNPLPIYSVTKMTSRGRRPLQRLAGSSPTHTVRQTANTSQRISP